MGKKLPKSIKLNIWDLPDDVTEPFAEAIGDYLSNKYGFCHNGFGLGPTIQVSDIDWDTKD